MESVENNFSQCLSCFSCSFVCCANGGRGDGIVVGTSEQASYHAYIMDVIITALVWSIIYHLCFIETLVLTDEIMSNLFGWVLVVVCVSECVTFGGSRSVSLQHFLKGKCFFCDCKCTIPWWQIYISRACVQTNVYCSALSSGINWS